MIAVNIMSAESFEILSNTGYFTLYDVLQLVALLLGELAVVNVDNNNSTFSESWRYEMANWQRNHHSYQ
jgi:hypothetical protein